MNRMNYTYYEFSFLLSHILKAPLYVELIYNSHTLHSLTMNIQKWNIKPGCASVTEYAGSQYLHPSHSQSALLELTKPLQASTLPWVSNSHV